MPTLPPAAAEYAARIDAALASYLDESLPRLVGMHHSLAPLADELRDFVARGGKRLRPMLVLLGHELGASDGDLDDVMGAAVAVELLHTCALLHDDVIDDADTRRGHPSTHVRFARLHAEAGEAGDPAHHGRSLAILLGDLAFVYADAALLSCRVPPERLIGGMAAFVRLREEVMAGQALDVLAASGRSVDPELALQVATLKSGRYSVTRPLQLGALLGGSGEDVLAVLERVGDPLGRAFQLRDDVLGVFGAETTTGKSASGDLAEGKRTLLIAEAWARLDGDGRAELGDRLGASDLTGQEADRLRGLIQHSGARAAVEARILAEVEAARAALADLKPGLARNTLAELTAWFTHRTA